MKSSFLDLRQDFTITQYVELLQLAKKNYKFVRYQEIFTKEKFVVWRHDCDHSLNRALRLAQLEHEESVKSTYFLNPHCEFYNLLEKGQTRLVEKILALDHDIGLHFDAAYYDIQSADQLDVLVEREANLLKTWFGITPVAFSFHNPTEFILSCEDEVYGGLLNCYSKTFKSNIPYCSDSNGYWRFKRLREVLESAEDSCLHVLTHPEWWQESPMTARERIFRCIDGRAISGMHGYDALLNAPGRINQQDLASEFKFITEVFGKQAESWNFRWMRGEYASVFIDLWRMFDARLAKICRIRFRKQICAAPVEVNSVLRSTILRLPVHKIIAVLCGRNWSDISGMGEANFLELRALRDDLVVGTKCHSKSTLESGMIQIVAVIHHLQEFEKKYPIMFVASNIEKSARQPVVKGACRAWLIRSRLELGLCDEALDEFAVCNE